MPPHRTPHPPAASPIRRPFDPYNSSATGHQRADSRLAGSTSWRASRTAKLSHQFRGGAGGGKRVYDSVGAGSLLFGRDGRKDNGGWEVGAVGLREGGWQDVRGLLGGCGGGGGDGVHRAVSKRVEREAVVASVRTTMGLGEAEEKKKEDDEGRAARKSAESAPTAEAEAKTVKEHEIGGRPQRSKKIFDGLSIYVNGSTAPLVGDHRLKYLLAEHGARVSIALGRRTVSHVVLGTPNGCAVGNGAGGGLAAGKIQKEIAKVGGFGVKFVGVEWVLESIKAGKRLPEAQFSTMRIAAKGQKSVYGMFKRTESGSDEKGVAAAGVQESVKGS